MTRFSTVMSGGTMMYVGPVSTMKASWISTSVPLMVVLVAARPPTELRTSPTRGPYHVGASGA